MRSSRLSALLLLAAVLSPLGAHAADDKPRPKPQWASHARRLRGTHRPGPGAWRASSR